MRLSLSQMVELATSAKQWEEIPTGRLSSGYPTELEMVDYKCQLDGGREIIFGVLDPDMIEGTFDTEFFTNVHFDSDDSNEDRSVVETGYRIYVSKDSPYYVCGKTIVGKYEIEIEAIPRVNQLPAVEVPRNRRKKSFEMLRDLHALIKEKMGE